MSEVAAKEHEAVLTSEVLGDALLLLRRLADADREQAGLLWQDFARRHPEMATHLAACGKERNQRQEHDLIIEQPDGAFLMRFCADAGVPWLGHYLESIADNLLLLVGRQHLTFQSAFHWMRLSGSLASLLDEFVSAAVLKESVSRMGIVINADEVQAGVDELRRAKGLLNADATRRWLKENHMSVEDLEDYVERLLVYQKTRRQVTEGRIDDYFSEHRAEFDLALLAHLVVANYPEAQSITERARQRPTDWAKLVCEHSLDRDTAETGGWLGLRPRRELPENVAEAAFAASPGAIVGPLMIAEGWEVLRVEDIRPSVLDERTREAVRETLFRAWLQEQRAQTPIHWYWEPQPTP